MYIVPEVINAQSFVQRSTQENWFPIKKIAEFEVQPKKISQSRVVDQNYARLKLMYQTCPKTANSGTKSILQNAI